MINFLIENQLKLINRARLIGNRSNRIVLAWNNAYFRHREMTGSPSSIEDDKEFLKVYAERTKYMKQKARRFLFNSSKMNQEEFEEWRNSIPKDYSKLGIVDWFMDVQTNVIGEAVERGEDNSKVVKLFDSAFFEHRKVQSLSSNGNLNLFQIRYEQRLDYMREKASAYLNRNNLQEELAGSLVLT